MLRKLTLLLATASILLVMAAPANADTATWYDLTGNYTASGDVLEYEDKTCASNAYGFGTHLLVTYGGLSAHCRVTDTGDMGAGLDLNVSVAERLGLISVGTAEVGVTVVGYDSAWYYGKQY